MENFAESVDGQLFRDRLLEVFVELSNGLIDFVERLQSMSEEEAQPTNPNSNLDCYIKM